MTKEQLIDRIVNLIRIEHDIEKIEDQELKTQIKKQWTYIYEDCLNYFSALE